MARFDLPQSKLKARRRRRRTAAAALWVVLAVVAVGAVAGLAHLPHLRIATVAAEGVEGTEARSVESIVRKHLAGRYLFLFPHDHVFLYPRAAIKKDLLETFPTFSVVELHTEALRSLHVQVEKRIPKAVWCGTARSAREPCLVLDQRGTAYEFAVQPSDLVYTTYFGALAEGHMPKQYLTEEPFRSLAALVETLETELQMRVVSAEVDSANDVRLRFADGFELIFALADGSGDVYERFALALTAAPFKNRSTADFQYLDLRFGDRLYYKLKGESPSEELDPEPVSE